MKKIFAVLMSLAMLTSIASTSFAAGELSRVIVSTSKSTKTVASTFPSGVKGTMGESEIDILMTELGKLTATKDIVQDISINSISVTSQPVSFWLKLELPANTKHTAAAEYSAIDYYSVRITTDTGRVVYDDEIAKPKASQEEKTIPIGELNADSKRNDTRKYNVTVSVNSDVTVSQLADEPEDVLWKIAYTDDKTQFVASPTPSATAPTYSPFVTSTPSGAVTPTPTATTTTRPTATVRPTLIPTATTPAKTIVVRCTANDTGTDTVKPGSYRLAGSGQVVVKDSANRTLAEFDLTTEPTAVTALKEGDTVTVTGDNRAYVQFKAPVATTRPTATPRATTRPTSTPRVTARPTATVRPTATAKTTAKPSATAKTNPKTGDNAPIVGVSAIALLAVGVVVYIGISSRKKPKK